MEEHELSLRQNLVARGLLSESEMATAASAAAAQGASLARYLIDAGKADKSDIYNALADAYGVP